MKVFYIANARMPTERAHGIQLAQMCQSFLDNGISLELILPNKKNQIKESIKEYYGLKDNIRVHKLPIIDVLSHTRLGFLIYSLSFTISYLIFIVLKIIKERRNIIIYTIDLDNFSFLPLSLLRVPYFIEIHGVKKSDFLFKVFFRDITGIITITESLKFDLVGKYDLDERKVMVQPNGIDLKKFFLDISIWDARKKVGIKASEKIVLYTGQFYDWKGLEILSDVAEKIKGKAVVHVVGGNENEYKNITGIKNISSNLVFHGVKNFKEMPLWLQSADILLVIGTKKNEISYLQTSPMKLFEYLPSKRPIIASDTPSNRQIVNEKEVFFYEPDNSDNLARIINEVLQDGGIIRDKIECSVNKTKEYTWKKRGERILNFINDRKKFLRTDLK